MLAKLPELHFHSCGYAYLDRLRGEGKQGERLAEAGRGHFFSLFGHGSWLLTACLALPCLAASLASLNLPRKSFTIDKPRQLFAFASAAQAATVNFMQ